VKLVVGAENLSLATTIFTPRNEKLDLGVFLQEENAKQNKKMNQKVHLCVPAPQLHIQKQVDYASL
jgi:hypothetical protein